MQNVFLYDTPFVHMPYVFHWQNRTLLLCSVFDATTGNWRPAVTDWDDELDPLHFLNFDTHRQDVCNLCAHAVENGLCLSYIANDGSHYRLYRTTTADLQSFTAPEMCADIDCWSGYSTEHHVVLAELNQVTMIERATNIARTYVFLNFETIFRVCFFQPQKMLITAMLADQLRTYIFDFADNDHLATAEIYANNEEIYKSCIYEDYLVVAKRAAPDDLVLNHRKLYYTQSFTTVDAPHIIVARL